MHAGPARDWTVDDLAREVAVSRSVLAQRFTDLVGETPMRYLANWRMQLAKQMMREGASNIQEVATRVGCESEAAFNRAFKRAPRLLASASGMYYTSVDGRRVLDGTAGLWCVNAGHCREPIVRAVQEAAATLDFAPGFQMGHPYSFALAQRFGRGI